MADIFELILSAPDGRERRMAAWLPSERVKQELYADANKRGLRVELNELN